MTIYEINEEQMRINAMLEESEGEITPEIEEALAINETNFAEKVKSYRNAILNYQAQIAAWTDEKKRQAERFDAEIKKMTKAVERMSSVLKDTLLGWGYEEYRINNGIDGKLSFRKSNKVIVDDEDWFVANAEKEGLEGCVTRKVSVNLTEIKKALADGRELPAHIEQNLNLQVK